MLNQCGKPDLTPGPRFRLIRRIRWLHTFRGWAYSKLPQTKPENWFGDCW